MLTYNDRCLGKCAYCGLSKSRYINGSWTEKSFIRVDWPIVPLEEVLRRTDDERCSHVERLCVSMVTHKRAREDTLTIVKALRKKIDAISGLITPTIVTKKWLCDLKEVGADKIGVAVDTATLNFRQIKRQRCWQSS